ncbi:hypothetical protein BGX38DRAFT_1222116, partial [Terfezia claveryi]
MLVSTTLRTRPRSLGSVWVGDVGEGGRFFDYTCAWRSWSNDRLHAPPERCRVCEQILGSYSGPALVTFQSALRKPNIRFHMTLSSREPQQGSQCPSGTSSCRHVLATCMQRQLIFRLSLGYQLPLDTLTSMLIVRLARLRDYFRQELLVSCCFRFVTGFGRFG